MSALFSFQTLETRRLLSTNLVADAGGIYPTHSVTVNGVSYFTANDGVYEPAMRATGNYSGQLWHITPAGNGTFRLTNEFRGPGNSLEAQPDGSLHMAPNKNDASQYFRITQL